MGYYKNMEIEQQVEISDRVPKPKGVTVHVAWPTRRLERQIEKATRRLAFRRRCVWALSILAGVTLVAVGVGLGVTL
jgi:hypothetical protein